MNFTEIPVFECHEGDMLASDVLNGSGVTLVAKNTVINDYIKEQLINLGVISVRIYNPSEEFNNSEISYGKFKSGYRDAVTKTQEVLHELAAGKPLDYNKVLWISEKIYKNVNESTFIVRCLSEVRSADQYTYNHSVNVAFYSMLLAKWLKFTDHKIMKAVQSGLLHDIGKTRIPNQILCKRGSLTKDEYEVIKKHSIFGYEMVKDIDDIDQEIRSVILLHHERFDGSGYPFNAGPGSINSFSRIIAVADVFDAMTSDRVYKKRMTPFDAFEMFMTVGTGLFDPKVLRVLMHNMSAYLVGSNVLLSNGDIGKIVYVPLQSLTCPIINVSSNYLDLSQSEMRIMSMI